MPEAQKTVAAGIRIGDGARDWSKAGHAADLFDVKADMLAALEAAMGAPMSAPVTPARPAWYHPGRSGTIALGPKVIAQFGELHPKVLAAFDLKVPAAGVRNHSSTPFPKPKPRARRGRCSRPRPFRRSSAISPLWWMRRWRPARSSRRSKLADRTLIETRHGVRCL